MPRSPAKTRTNRPTDAQIANFMASEAQAFLVLRNVTGVGITRKRVGGELTDQWAVVFDVAVKLTTRAELAAAGTSPLPAQIKVGDMLLPTDVVERRYIPHAEIVRPGASVSNAKGRPGTAGPIVRMRDRPGLFLLSNWHVLAHPADETATIQPGRGQGGSLPGSRLGRVVSADRSRLDAALSSIEGRRISQMIANLDVKVTSFRSPRPGDRVMKFGQSSKITRGVVDQTHKAQLRSWPDTIDFTEIKSVVITQDDSWPESRLPISGVGDSGSAWMLVKDGKPTTTMLALHWGGDNLGFEAYAVDIMDIAETLGIEPATDADLMLNDPQPLMMARSTIGRLFEEMQVHLRSNRAFLRPNPMSRPEVDPLLNPGTRVFVLDRMAMPDGFTWMQVDLEGDGLVDGWVRGDLLGPVGDTQPVMAAARNTPAATIDGRAIARAAGVEVKSAAVNIGALHPAMGPVIPAVADAARALGLPTPVITSGNDSRHSPGSLHFSGRALDFRGNNISDEQGRALARDVSRRLGADFDVIFELSGSNPANDHLHVEFDPD